MKSTQSNLTCCTELGSSGRYTLIVLASNDLPGPCGRSHKALQSSSKILDSFPAGVIDLVVLQPLTTRFEWTHLPSCVKELAEMKTYSPAKREDAYEIYGIADEAVQILLYKKAIPQRKAVQRPTSTEILGRCGLLASTVIGTKTGARGSAKHQRGF